MDYQQHRIQEFNIVTAFGKAVNVTKKNVLDVLIKTIRSMKEKHEKEYGNRNIDAEVGNKTSTNYFADEKISKYVKLTKFIVNEKFLKDFFKDDKTWELKQVHGFTPKSDTAMYIRFNNQAIVMLLGEKEIKSDYTGIFLMPVYSSVKDEYGYMIKVMYDTPEAIKDECYYLPFELEALNEFESAFTELHLNGSDTDKILACYDEEQVKRVMEMITGFTQKRIVNQLDDVFEVVGNEYTYCFGQISTFLKTAMNVFADHDKLVSVESLYNGEIKPTDLEDSLDVCLVDDLNIHYVLYRDKFASLGLMSLAYSTDEKVLEKYRRDYRLEEGKGNLLIMLNLSSVEDTGWVFYLPDENGKVVKQYFSSLSYYALLDKETGEAHYVDLVGYPSSMNTHGAKTFDLLYRNNPENLNIWSGVNKRMLLPIYQMAKELGYKEYALAKGVSDVTDLRYFNHVMNTAVTKACQYVDTVVIE